MDLSAAAGLLAGVHAAIALRRNEPHWMLSDADAKRYGLALANALRHMPVKVAQKYLDFSTLAFCVFEMETPRVMRSRQLAADKRRGPIPPGGATVFQFRPQPGAPGAAGQTPPANAEPEPPLAEGPADLGIDGDFGPL